MSLIAILLTAAAEKFVDTLAQNFAGDLYQRIKGNPTKQAYKRALGAAIDRYATGERLPLARPLFDKKANFLTDKEVVTELTQLLRFEREPNLELIGEKWKAALSYPPRFRNFTEDARLLVDFMEKELRSSEVFRTAFLSRDVAKASFNAEESVESLERIEEQLVGLIDLLDARLGLLLEEFTRASLSMRDQIRDFNRLIEEKTRGFIGRQWVLDAVTNFMETNPRGYFFIIGDPGIGKSALAAQMIKQNGWVHHFNIRAEGINSPSAFLRNINAQLIVAYDLEYTVLPPDAADDAGFFNKLLGEISEKLRAGEHCVILIDALDEVDLSRKAPGVNVLYLPLTVPKGVYIVATCRPADDKFKLPRIDCEQGELTIDHDSSDNLSDVTDYVRASTARQGIKAYIQAQQLDVQVFVDMMVKKSEGNFMYLRYVLPEIERGPYKDRVLEDLPQGLKDYYQDHWSLMRGMDENAWFDYKLPVLVALTTVLEPVSIDLICGFSRVDDRRRVRAVLREWNPFLHQVEVEYQDGRQTRYRLYHISFFEFMATKEEVAEEQVDLKAMDRQISDYLAAGLGLPGDE